MVCFANTAIAGLTFPRGVPVTGTRQTGMENEWCTGPNKSYMCTTRKEGSSSGAEKGEKATRLRARALRNASACCVCLQLMRPGLNETRRSMYCIRLLAGALRPEKSISGHDINLKVWAQTKSLRDSERRRLFTKCPPHNKKIVSYKNHSNQTHAV